MDAIKYLQEKARMCDSFEGCADCLIIKDNDCSQLEMTCPEKAVAIVEKWAAEHPQKTIFQDFLEKYPNASLTSYGTPHICPCELGYEEKKPEICFSRRCIDCWNRPIEGEVRNDRRKMSL